MAEIGKDVRRAKSYLEKGELVAIPTETVYGLAANALDPLAVTKIFITKERPSFDPLIIHVASADQVNQFVEYIPEQAKKLINHFWPGPLTVLLPKKSIIPDLVTSGLSTVGIRCPDHPLTQQLLQSLEFPLAAPSANPFGYISPTSAQHVQDQLGSKIHYILDGGLCEIGLESTIIGFEEGNVALYRRGGVNDDQITNVVGPIKLKLSSSSNPLAPGQLESHYAPKKMFLLGNIETLEKKYGNVKKGVLRFQQNSDHQKHTLYLSKSGDLNEAARNLFTLLRQLDNMEVDIILAEPVPDVGIGKAINDRLRRAAVKHE
ncbi:MAG TPA: L-threonylcarbamoyladenylate synthase [Cyclobacteriaceae bacterium]